MECADVRALADRYLDGELPVDAGAAVRQHAEACPPCWLDLQWKRECRLALRQAFERSRVLMPPPGIEESIRARVREYQAAELAGSTRRGSYQLWALAATVLIALGASLVGSLLSVSTPSRAIAAMAAGDHRNCAVRFRLAEQPITLDAAVVRFDPAFAVLTTLPPESTAGPSGALDVVARHSCVYAGHRFGHVVLRYGDALLSLLVTAKDAGATGMEAGTITAARAGALNTVQLHTDRHTVVIIADLPADDLQQIAALLAVPVARQLGRL